MSHLKDVKQSYAQHFVSAAVYALKLHGLGVIAFIHAVFPYLFTETVSNAVQRMHESLEDKWQT